MPSFNYDWFDQNTGINNINNGCIKWIPGTSQGFITLLKITIRRGTIKMPSIKILIEANKKMFIVDKLYAHTLHKILGIVFPVFVLDEPQGVVNTQEYDSRNCQ